MEYLNLMKIRKNGLINIICIEDENDADESIKVFLSGAIMRIVFNVIYSDTVKNAIDILHREPFDIVLMDLNLNETKGIDSFTIINNEFPKLPIIVISGVTDKNVQYNILAKGAKDFIQKNKLSSQTLTKAIVSIIHKSLLNCSSEEKESSDSAEGIEEKARPKILVVDDIKENIIAMKSLLKYEKMDVISAFSGEEALELLLDNEIALILLDVQMPVMDGFETAKLIRSYDKTKTTPIIFLSAIFHDKPNMFKGYDSGAIDYILKPFDHEILLSKIRFFIKLYLETKEDKNLILNKLKLAKKELENKNKNLEFIAKHDSLTMLYNRYSFEEQLKKTLASAKRYRRKFALFIIDIDNFKLINDTYGHDCGDAVLQYFSDKMRIAIREVDYIARLGGDEFAVVLSEIDDDKSSEIVASKIINQLIDSVEIFDKNISFTCSIGIACYPSMAKDAITLFKNADIALYLAKNEGKNRFKFYEKALFEPDIKKVLIEKKIAKALKHEEFELYFQPIVNMKSKAIIGIETFLRWKNSEIGDVLPLEFLQIAEKQGIMSDIGFWVIEKSCYYFSKIIKEGFGNLFFSINLSFAQLEDDFFLKKLKEILLKFNFSNVQLDIEMMGQNNCSNFMSKSDLSELLYIKQVALRLNANCAGIENCSESLSLLSVNLYKIKLNSSWVKDPDANEKYGNIIQRVSKISKSLNMEIIAEYVETREQADFLLKYGCELAQGFLFYKPMPIEELIKALSENKIIDNISNFVP